MAAAAVVIGAAGGAAIYAAVDSPEPQTANNGKTVESRGPAKSGGPLGEISHGEFQSGEVTELTEDAITAKSEDGYTKTYTIDADTILMEGVEKGDDVTIMASTEGDKATARTVIEQGEIPQRRNGGDGSPSIEDGN